MRKKILPLIIAIFIICPHGEARQATTIPPTVLYLVNHHYPGWVVFRYSDLSESARTWLKDITHPGWIKADFNGDGAEDHAVLLFKKKISTDFVKMKFCIFLSTAARKELKPLVIVEKYYDLCIFANMYLTLVPAGTLVKETMAGPENKVRKQVVLKSPAVEIVYRECSSVLYYWNKIEQKFEEIWTSD